MAIVSELRERSDDREHFRAAAAVNQQTRGERNRNPGNIVRNATVWAGMSPDQSADPRFVVFTAPVYGIRACAMVLLSYHEHHGIDTVRGFIDRWAPWNENNTAAYIGHVAHQLGVEPDAPVDVRDPQTLRELVKAIIRHENGRCIYTEADITEAVQKALD